MQLIAFDVGDDFVVEADLVQVAAAVIQVVDLSAVGQDGGGTVAVEVVVVADGSVTDRYSMSYCASRQSVSGKPFRAFSSLDDTFHWCWAISWPFSL